MDYYCTLFDSNYLLKGLTMYRSLFESGDSFHLFVFAFDQECEDVLNRLELDNITVIGLALFESPILLKKKKERSRAEYCWTCTSFTIAYVLDNFFIDEVTYLDADLYFFDRPSILLNEFKQTGADVLLTEHRYDAGYNMTATSGKYCVQFMTFRNTRNGRHILQWWQDRCSEWCFSHVEEGKFGDQKYLDDWEKRFIGVHSLQNIGGGVAIWNIAQYLCSDGPLIDGKKIIFYHFHHFRWEKKSKYIIGRKVDESVIRYIYEPYLYELKKSYDKVKRVEPCFRKIFERNRKRVACYLFMRMKRDLTIVELRHLFGEICGQGRPLFLWGAGKNGRAFAARLLECEIDIAGFIDCDKRLIGKLICGRSVYSPEYLQGERAFVVITPDHYYESIRLLLENMRYRQDENYMHLQNVIDKVLHRYVQNYMYWALDKN